MATNRRYKRRKAKKGYKRKRRTTTRSVPRGLSLIKPTQGNPLGVGLPQRLYMKMVYQYAPFQVSDGSFPYKGWNFMINNLTDLDVTGTGAQPALRDNMVLLYNRSKVMKVHIHLDVANNHTSPIKAYAVYLNRNSAIVANPSLDIATADGTGKEILVGAGATGASVSTLRITYDLAKIHGKSYGEAGYYNVGGSAPAIPLYVQFGIYNMFHTGACNAWIQPKIELEVEWSDPTNEGLAVD